MDWAVTVQDYRAAF